MKKRAFITAYLRQYGGTPRQARRVYRHASQSFRDLIINLV